MVVMVGGVEGWAEVGLIAMAGLVKGSVVVVMPGRIEGLALVAMAG